MWSAVGEFFIDDKPLYRRHPSTSQEAPQRAGGMLLRVRVLNGNLAVEEEILHKRSVTSVI
jgi:hypothetical protein